MAEIERWGNSRWAVAVQPKLPIDYPLDHPDLHLIWAAAQEHGLCVIHHSLPWRSLDGNGGSPPPPEEVGFPRQSVYLGP